MSERADDLIEFFDLHTRSHWVDRYQYWYIGCGCGWKGTAGHTKPETWLAHRRRALIVLMGREQ
jgi:hypothetical protein